MSDTFTAVIDNKAHNIEAKPLTLVFKDPKLLSRVDYPDLVRIEPQDAHRHAEEAESVHPLALRLTAHVFEVDPNTLTLDGARKLNREVIQTVGFMDLAIKCMETGVRFVLVEPEAGLHPRNQCEMADVMIFLSGLMSLEALEGTGK